MSRRVLLYGATGFSGRLIAAQASSRGFDFVLGSRDVRELRRLAARTSLAFRSFGLDDQRSVLEALRGFGVVVNAAGPFNQTAERLAKAAILSGCDYVDINGEADVYNVLDDLNESAKRRGVVMVCGAGHTATVSDLMLHFALGELKEKTQVGSVRFAFSQIPISHFSRGSARTMLRSVREQVTVARVGIDPKSGERTKDLRLMHEPVGKLERSFDFSIDREGPQKTRSAATKIGKDARDPLMPSGDLRITTAANLIDTLVARYTTRRHDVVPDRIESYLEMPLSQRVGYQLSAMSSVFFRVPGVRQALAWQIGQLPDGPDRTERATTTSRVVLQIEDSAGEPLVDRCIETPDPYDFTARCVVEIARRLADDKKGLSGWVTPSGVLSEIANPFTAIDKQKPLWAECRFEVRQ